MMPRIRQRRCRRHDDLLRVYSRTLPDGRRHVVEVRA